MQKTRQCQQQESEVAAERAKRNAQEAKEIVATLNNEAESPTLMTATTCVRSQITRPDVTAAVPSTATATAAPADPTALPLLAPTGPALAAGPMMR